MKLRTNLIAAVRLVALLALTALLLSGCGGGSGSTGITTGVTGFVVDADTQLGIGNIVVQVGSSSGVSATPDGRFTIAVSPEVHMLSVVPTDLFVPVPPGTPVPVTVLNGSVTYVGNVYVIDRNSLPPSG